MYNVNVKVSFSNVNYIVLTDARKLTKELINIHKLLIIITY